MMAREMSAPSPRALLLLAAVSGGVVGGFVSYGVMRAGHPATKAAPSASAANDLDERMAALEAKVGALGRQRALGPALRAVLAAPAKNAAAPATSGGDDTRGSADGSALVDDPVFEAAVRNVVDRAQEERENERQLQRDEQRRAAAQRWSSELGEKLGLRDEQKAALETLAREFYDGLRETLRGGDAGAPVGFEARREAVRTLRDKYEGKLGGVLDAGQMREYEKLDDALKLGARPRFRGPP